MIMLKLLTIDTESFLTLFLREIPLEEGPRIQRQRTSKDYQESQQIQGRAQ